MIISYDGVNEQVISGLGYTDELAVGDIVKMDSYIQKCADGDEFLGVCKSITGGFEAMAGVQVGGVVKLRVSGTTITNYGFTGLVADGNGGVKLSPTAKKMRYILETNPTDKTVTIIL